MSLTIGETRDNHWHHDYDAIIIGTGLGGLTTALKLLTRNKRVMIIDKASTHGGNSIMASSGINGVPTRFQPVKGDSVSLFIDDSLKSGKGLCNERLVKLLAENSRLAINWLADDLGVDLSVVSQLGGHSMPRTHRGHGGAPGYKIITSVFDKIKFHPQATILMNCKLTRILMHDNLNTSPMVKGIEFENLVTKQSTIINSKNLILATGGYSADVNTGDSLVKKFRPDLVNFPSTNSILTSGDGQKICQRDCNAKLIDMNEIQIHPTGFVKFTPEDINHGKKILCGELLRGIGGILVSPVTGGRFANELETRDKLSQSILNHCNTSQVFDSKTQCLAIIIISKNDYYKAESHIDFYVKLGLLFEGNIHDLHKLGSKINPNLKLNTLLQTIDTYNTAIKYGDKLGRKTFGSTIDVTDIYYGVVTPVLHYTMGGVKINEFSNVVTNKDETIDNLYAVGEVSGGVHGHNRLSGSSLLQCVVFGTMVANRIAKSNK